MKRHNRIFHIFDIIYASIISCRNRKLFKSGDEFFVYYKDLKIALLKNPVFSDMFWFYYDLIPLHEDMSKKEILYSSEFWLSSDMTIKECQSGLACKMFIAFDVDEEVAQWKSQSGKLVSITDRPKKILLRGPYLEKY